jgi:hypothetical protein
MLNHHTHTHITGNLHMKGKAADGNWRGAGGRGGQMEGGEGKREYLSGGGGGRREGGGVGGTVERGDKKEYARRRCNKP